MGIFSEHLCAVDIGSSKVAAVLAYVKKSRIAGIYFESMPVKGVQKGTVTDSVDLVDALTRLLGKLKSRSGIRIKSIYANISGQDIISRHSHAVIPLAERGNKVITMTDIYRVTEQARILGSSLEEEILHQMPSSYSIDSQNAILNPLGLYSHRLEVDLHLICARLSSVQSLVRAVNQAGYELKDLFFSGLATTKVVYDPGQLCRGINVFCDIGSDITEVLIFQDGVLKDILILNAGGNDLTARLSEVLKIPPDLAEEVKRSYGAVQEGQETSDDREILVKKSTAYKPIKYRLIADTLTRETKVICESIKESLSGKVDLASVDNFTVAGQTVLLDGFLETLESILDFSVRLARLQGPLDAAAATSRGASAVEMVKDILSLEHSRISLGGQKYMQYITALGLLCEALSDPQSMFVPARKHLPKQHPILRTVSRLKDMYQEYF